MKPRVGFLGTGWIGRHRMAAICATGAIEPVAFCDPSDECAAAAREVAPQMQRAGSLDDLLGLGLDGLVIATPSAGHAAESIAALERGVAVFCQKPLGRSGAEARAVVEAARIADRLLGVDFSYRRTAAVEAIEVLLARSELGKVFALDLTFHNAYGPDKDWFYDRARSGGGCVMDLGVHLIDLALWSLGFPAVESVTAQLFAGGEPARADQVEDYATVQLGLAGGVAVRLTCSWRLQAGTEAVIAAHVHGTEGGALLRNLGGSFYDFEALRLDGTHSTVLTTPPDEWGGRVAADWARRLAQSAAFDPAAEGLVTVAETVERIYASAGIGGGHEAVDQPAEGPARIGDRVVELQREPGPAVV